MLTWDARWALADDGQIYLEGSYVLSDAEFDEVHLEPAADLPIALFGGALPGCEGGTGGGPLNFHDYDFSGINEYSALRYAEFRSTLGALVTLAPRIDFFGELTFLDLQDDTAYLFQDVSGSVMLASSGLRFSF